MNATQLTQSYRETLQNTINYYNRMIYNINSMRLNYRTKQYYIGVYKNRFNEYHKALNIKFHNSLVSLVKPGEIKITKNKRGLLIGINYNGTDAQLNGCINDTNSIYTALTSNYGFKSADISIITDNTEKKPTRDEILSAFKAFLESGAAVPST